MNFVTVGIRIKPDIPKNFENNCLEVLKDDPSILYIPSRNQTYLFDKIFNKNVDQSEIFIDLINPLIDKALSGYNCTVFTYGQTGTGKTYTMGSDAKFMGEKDEGIIRRVFKAIFHKGSPSLDINVEIAIYEIYQEKIYDLLSDKKIALSAKGFNVVNLTKIEVNDIDAVEKLLLKSCSKRHTGKTKQNNQSSRSHAIFTIFLKMQDGNKTKDSKFNLVDLAGCENVKKAGAQDNQFNETVKINMGLLAIGQVINALASNKTCVPYRESMLTRILYDSLNKRNYIVLLACVSPRFADIHETVQTLEFALRAKKLKNKPELNSILTEHSRTLTSKRQNTVLQDMRTPMKRENEFRYTSTAIKRPKMDVPLPTTSEEFHQNVVTPIAKSVLNKLEDHFGQDDEFSLANSKLYDTMCKLIKEEVHLQTSNSGKCSNPITRKDQRKSSLSSMERHQQLNSSVHEARISNTVNEISPIRKISGAGMNLSDTIRHTQENIIFNNTKEDSSPKQQNAPHFKIPELPKRFSVTFFNSRRNERQSVNTKNSLVSYQTISIIHPRRSVRLSMKRNANTDLNSISPNVKSNSFCISEEKIISDESENETPSILKNKKSTRKRKYKFSLKKKQTQEDTDSDNSDSSILRTSSRSRDSLDIIDTSQEEIFDENTLKIFPVFAQRRSIRLSTKRSRNLASPSMVDNRSVSTTTFRKSTRLHSRREIPSKKNKIEKHMNNILRILNKGNVKDLQKLHTIGQKTAEQIFLYRNLNGTFGAINDIKHVLCRGKSFERFLGENCLILNDI